MTWADVGVAAAEALLTSIQATAAEAGITEDGMPAEWIVATGDGIPTEDACDGMVWVRVGNVWPTDGTGAPPSTAGFDYEPSAWAYAIETGFLWCHTNITEDGSWIDLETERGYAERDGLWRTVLLAAAAYRWRDSLTGNLALAVSGQTISPYQPVGPQGGYSGGIVVVTAICTGVALC